MERFRFTELSSAIIEGDILDENGDPVPQANLTAVLLTLYDLETASLDTSPITGIINSRDQQDANNANDVTIDSTSPDTTGHFIWSVQPEDNVVITKRRQLERHKVLIHFAWATGTFNYEAEIEVVNLRMSA